MAQEATGVDGAVLATAQWRAASEALDEVCRTLAAVPGAGDQYEALCRLTTDFQRKAGPLLDAAIASAAAAQRA